MGLKTRNTDRSESDITKSIIPLTMDEMDENFLYLYDKIPTKIIAADGFVYQLHIVDNGDETFSPIFTRLS